MIKEQITQDDYYHAEALMARAKSNNLTNNDITILSKCPTTCRNHKEAATWYLGKVKKSLSKQRIALTRQGLLFDFAQYQAAAPNIMFKSALFSPIARGKRKWLNDVRLGEWAGVAINYTGATLDQADFDVLLVLGRVLRDATTSGNVENITDSNGKIEYRRVWFTIYGFYKELGRSKGGGTKKWLLGALERLRGAIKVEKDVVIVSGPIVGKYARHDTQKIMYVDINHDFARLFNLTGYTLIDWEKRKELSGGVAKWLQGYVCANALPHYQTTRGVMDLCGSTTGRDRDFKRKQLIPALEELKKLGIIKKYSYKGHKIRWE